MSKTHYPIQTGTCENGHLVNDTRANSNQTKATKCCSIQRQILSLRFFFFLSWYLRYANVTHKHTKHTCKNHWRWTQIKKKNKIEEKKKFFWIYYVRFYYHGNAYRWWILTRLMTMIHDILPCPSFAIMLATRLFFSFLFFCLHRRIKKNKGNSGWLNSKYIVLIFKRLL